MYLVWHGAGCGRFQCFQVTPTCSTGWGRLLGAGRRKLLRLHQKPREWLGRPEPTRSGALFSTWVGAAGVEPPFPSHAMLPEDAQRSVAPEKQEVWAEAGGGRRHSLAQEAWP